MLDDETVPMPICGCHEEWIWILLTSTKIRSDAEEYIWLITKQSSG